MPALNGSVSFGMQPTDTHTHTHTGVKTTNEGRFPKNNSLQYLYVRIFPSHFSRIIAYRVCLKDELRETSTNSDGLLVPQNPQIYFTSRRKANEFFPVYKNLAALLPALRRSLKTHSALTIYGLPKRFTNTKKLGAHQLSLWLVPLWPLFLYGPRVCGHYAPAKPSAMQKPHLSSHLKPGQQEPPSASSEMEAINHVSRCTGRGSLSREWGQLCPYSALLQRCSPH